MSWTITGPYDLFQRYAGRQFGSGGSLVRIGITRNEGAGVVNRRSAIAHAFRQEWIEAFQSVLEADGVLDKFDFARAGLPEDWREAPPGLILDLPQARILELVPTIQVVDAEVLELLKRDPGGIYALSPRAFEEVVAELLSKMGFDVVLTPESRDGGIDVIAISGGSLHDEHQYLVQCKRHQPSNKVGVGVVRQLYGVVGQRQATAGIVVTSSYFTRDARAFQETISKRMTLRDFNDLERWLKREGG